MRGTGASPVSVKTKHVPKNQVSKNGAELLKNSPATSKKDRRIFKTGSASEHHPSSKNCVVRGAECQVIHGRGLGAITEPLHLNRGGETGWSIKQRPAAAVISSGVIRSGGLPRRRAVGGREGGCGVSRVASGPYPVLVILHKQSATRYQASSRFH